MSISAVLWDDRSILKDRAPIPTLSQGGRNVGKFMQIGVVLASKHYILYIQHKNQNVLNW